MITATHLGKIFYDGDKTVKAIDDISFVVPSGKLFTLLGPSGCGKTTTLRCIAGLETPSSGEIKIGDQVVFDDKRGAPCRRISAISAWYFSPMPSGRI
jgi:iron(III) transport system ATP-binding protein